MADYETEERHIHEMLALLQENYYRAAKPYIDKLVMLQNHSKPEPMIVTIEQARSMGFEVPPITKGE